MDKREPHERLVQARERAGYASATDAARAFGWNENTYRSHENGERGLRTNVALKYAQAFRTTASSLLTGESEDNYGGVSFYQPISGYMNDSGFISDYPSQGRNGYDGSIAVSYVRPVMSVVRVEVIVDRPFLKFSNGDLLMMAAESVSLEQSLGKYAMIEMDDGRSAVRLVRQGLYEGSIDIETNNENPPSPIVPKGIFLIVAIIPRGMWTKTPLSEWRRQDEEFLAKQAAMRELYKTR